MATHGLARFPQILTEEDVIRHFYSEGSSGAEGAVDEDVADTEPPPAGSDPEPAAPTAGELESRHTKAELIAMAEQAGLDTSGTKADIAGRLAAHHSSV